MFVVITKTALDVDKSGVPLYFPLECEEFETYEEASECAAQDSEFGVPSRQVMTAQGYKDWVSHLALEYPQKKTPNGKRPWWRFWGKA